MKRINFREKQKSGNLLVIATSTMYASSDKIRPKLALRLAKLARSRNYPLVVVDGGGSEEFRQKLRNFNAFVFKQKAKGFGQARRQAYREAAKIIGRDGAIVATEPEKYSLIPELPKLYKSVVSGRADFVIPYRKSMASYPPEQEYVERLVNIVVKYLVGKDFDFPFGPFVMGKKALPYFLNYKGEYGDLWDSHQIPKLRAVKKGLKVLSIKVNYRHPREQTLEETGNINFIQKRMEQLQNQIPAFIKENQKLKK